MRRIAKIAARILSAVGLWALAQSASLIFTAGLAMLSAGCACYDPPLGLIVAGGILTGLTATMHLIAFCRGG